MLSGQYGRKRNEWCEEGAQQTKFCLLFCSGALYIPDKDSICACKKSGLIVLRCVRFFLLPFSHLCYTRDPFLHLAIAHPYSRQVPLLVREPDGALVPEDDADGFGRVVLYQDGSMDADLPTQQLSELFNVNHFIVSQVTRHGACGTRQAYEHNAKFAPILKMGLLSFVQ